MALEKVMVVDDDTDILTVARMALELVNGWTVDCISEPEDAVARASEWRPDVILLDWMMPNMTGVELLHELRNNPATAQIPVLFITAKVQSDDRQVISDLGCTVVAKPFDPLLLGSEIERVFNSQSSSHAA